MIMSHHHILLLDGTSHHLNTKRGLGGVASLEAIV